MKIWFTAKDVQLRTPYHRYFKILFIFNLVLFVCFSFILSHQAHADVYSFSCIQQQQIHVTGQVVDQNGNPLAGVSIRVRGTNAGAITDNNGRFQLDAPAGSVLEISFIGYQTQTITLGNENQNLRIQLQQSASVLNQLVVIGYGTQRREAVTGSVASITGAQMREVPASNITYALQGRLPGVELSQTDSKPGATMQIRIRGTRSLTASNDPLIVLDGIPFPGSISDIDPNIIKSIDILKDASATAIYGSRGANGVILITTDKGTAGEKARISYNSYVGIKKVFAEYPMMNGPEFVALRKAAGMYTNGPDENDSINTDWQSLLYRTAFVTNHELSVAGGTQHGGYNFGIGYYHDESVIPTQQYERYSLHGTLDQGVGKYFKVGFSTNNNFSISQGNQIDLYNVLSMSPISSPYNPDGSLKRIIQMPLDQQWVETKYIIDSLKDKWLSQTKSYGSYNSLYGEVSIPWVEGLKYRINLGLNFRSSAGGSYTGEGINSSNPTTPSTASISNSLTTDWVVENLLTYDHTFREKHQINVTALYSAEQSRYNSSYISAKDIPNDAFQFYNLGQATGEITIDPNNQNYQESGLLSWMGRIMYAYNDKYMLSVAVRSDGSSRLAPGHQWHTYPAISAGWNIANESFMKGITQINQLKLRVGFGQTSNQAIAPYSTLGRLSTLPYNFGENTYAVGYYVSQLPNPNLGWEYSKTWNYGLDFALFNNRLSGTFEYYITNTNDILLSVNLPITSGVGSYVGNIGATQNKGWELSLNGTILDRPGGFRWEAGFNIYSNHNKIVQLASGTQRDEANWWFVGYPINVIYDYQKIGLWQQGDPYLDVLEPGGNVGMIKVKYTGGYDNNGKPLRAIGPDDRQIMKVDPDFEGGFNTRLSYKGFDLTAVGVFQHGGILISTLYSANGYLDLLTGRRNNVKVDYWTPDHTNAKFPKPGGIMSGDNPKYGSTLGYFSASYLKIRTITLGYNFTSNGRLKKIGIDNLRIYATVQNPFVMFSPFHKESGLDPETNSYGDQNAAVTTAYPHRLLTLGTNAPSTRNYLIGINCSF
ncbi:MAG: TonB-dependent receptor [Thermoflavifilum sp.]|uniref:SusC/RagA family TonB-linked outer membrane protein n=1 Tax=Thermoflavifilum sp. TaxID=1968839 RepID=UPI0018A651B5|nr:TonB-dependent receptor [Thermoflavifilum sp.]QOR75584.1 MAG: TonB-dependent receptor [Thermoflavifilum sp.]